MLSWPKRRRPAPPPLTFNIGVVSLYKASGIDQDVREPKNFRPALQGGADYTADNGLYAGFWASTGKFGNSAKADLEIDLYGGYRGAITEDLSYDIGLTQYVYPGDSAGWNAKMWSAKLRYGVFTLDVGRGITSKDREVIKGSVALLAAVPLTEQLTLNARYGVRANSGPKDFSLGLGYDFGDGLLMSASVSGAEKSKIGPAGTTRLVVGILKTF